MSNLRNGANGDFNRIDKMLSLIASIPCMVSNLSLNIHDPGELKFGSNNLLKLKTTSNAVTCLFTLFLKQLSSIKKHLALR